MPVRNQNYRRFDPARAQRILRLCDLSQTAFARLYNRRMAGAVTVAHVSAWINGRRPLPDAAVMLLKALVRERRLQRANERLRRHLVRLMERG